MQKHNDITRQRLRTFVEERGLKGRIYPEKQPVELWVYHAPDRISYQEAVLGNYVNAKVGEVFGPAWSTHWFKVITRIPKNWEGKEIHFLWDSSSEACVWMQGKPRQGLTGTGMLSWEMQMGRPAYRLSHSAKGGEELVFYVEMACNGLFGSEPGSVFPLKRAEIALFDPQAWDLFWDFVVIADMAHQLSPNTPRAGQALWTANEMINTCLLENPSTWPQTRKIAREFFQAHNGDSQHNVSAIGYAHLDTAWLWPLAESKRKAVRTFTNALRLMEDYPDYRFACAQAQHLAWIKELHPDLYHQVKRRIHEGRFVIVGGTWVEPDCNIPSGESLIRQFLLGQRFFQEEFGFSCTEFWNPDVFGYSAALPQIMRGSGIRYFLTQKLSWNQINKPANHTFLWEGIDGSQVLTHFPPADTYGSSGNVADVLRSITSFKEHDRAKESILIFGWGDGGGGPTPEMIEQLERMKDVDGLPRVTIRPVSEFFKRCEEDIKDPAVWVGELYFEYHRGTYTTQAANKKNNRLCEFLLRDVELLSSIGFAFGRQPYPQEEINRLWKLVLLNQFHDILPGSSINMVYRDSDIQYAEVLQDGESLRKQAMSSLLPSGNYWSVINTLGKERVEVVELPFELNTPQVSAHGKPLAVLQTPGMSWSPVRDSQSSENYASIEVIGKSFRLENLFLRVEFNQEGRLTKLYDKRLNREAVPQGDFGNRFVLFDDDPINFEAWDVDIFHLEKKQVVGGAHSARIIESGPLRVAVEFEYSIGSFSRLSQVISLTACSPRLDFVTRVDWHETKKFLKVEFPWEIRSEFATYEIQFGHVQRPTHFNTTWDLARFEVCAHRWADFSEPGFGIAIFNDCKYGYSTRKNMMSLSLLRAPKSPDPEADMGYHSFRYGLLPHNGSFREAGVIEEGYRFNVPLQFHQTSRIESSGSLFSVDCDNVVIDTIKKSEDGSALIVRLYESFGARGSVFFSSLLPIKSAAKCNLIEENDIDLVWKQGIQFIIRPFEIITLKLSI